MSTAIIIPCYNEDKRLNFFAYETFAKYCPHFDLYFVNDGSTDNTRLLLNDFCKNNPAIKLLDLKTNIGKANALREAVLSLSTCDYEFIGYLDADLATPLEELLFFSEVFKAKPNLQCVMGARVDLLGRNVHRKLSRHYLGRIFATLASFALDLRVYDTQCGAKIFRKEMATEIFHKPFISRWLFDIELLFRIKKSKQITDITQTIYEFPLTRWIDIPGSKLKLRDFIKAPYELLKIYWHYH